jgi:uncharacterized protein (DUF779 family)
MAKKRKSTAPAPTADQTQDLLAKIKKLEKYRKQARANFAAADRVSEEIINVLRTRGGSISLDDGRVCRIVDSFADRNKAFKNVYMERFTVAIQ